MLCISGRKRWLILALVACLAGCKGLFGNQGLPQDPLFLDRKPLEVKAVSTAPATLASVELAPPTVASIAAKTRTNTSSISSPRPEEPPRE
jgi:hypothetical protein